MVGINYGSILWLKTLMVCKISCQILHEPPTPNQFEFEPYLQSSVCQWVVWLTGHCETLVLMKEDFKNVLQASVQKQWDEVRRAMSSFTYFEALDEVRYFAENIISAYHPSACFFHTFYLYIYYYHSKGCSSRRVHSSQNEIVRKEWDSTWRWPGHSQFCLLHPVRPLPDDRISASHRYWSLGEKILLSLRSFRKYF